MWTRRFTDGAAFQDWGKFSRLSIRSLLLLVIEVYNINQIQNNYRLRIAVQRQSLEVFSRAMIGTSEKRLQLTIIHSNYTGAFFRTLSTWLIVQ